MTRGTTPTITIDVNGTDLTEYEDIEITFRQGSTLVEKTLSSGAVIMGEDSKLKTKLTQSETLMFRPEPVKIQLRAITDDGMVVASDIVMKTMKDILNESVMENDQTNSDGGSGTQS